MKTTLIVIACMFICCIVCLPCSGQVGVWHEPVVQSNVNLRGAPVVLAQKTIHIAEPGSVLVQFDGQCYSEPGDRIVLAASKTQFWYGSDGHTEVEAFDSGNKIRPFSHSRMYPVTPGEHTFYAVGENYVETAGSGWAGVFGSLTVKFFPDEGDGSLVTHTGIEETYLDVRGGSVVVAQREITVGVAGSALVRFDGICVSDPGDRIMLAASNTTSWGTNDGTVAWEAVDNDLNTTSFSHSRMYTIAPGTHTFYAVAENYVEMEGNGLASIYASLTVEFFPATGGGATVDHVGIIETDIDVEGAPVVMGQLTINPATGGTAIVRYEGCCMSDDGDRIIQAASHDTDWDPNDGNVSVEVVNDDQNISCFSHSRAYTIPAGSRTFYAVCENYSETAGNGLASNYASLSVEFFPDYVTAVEESGGVPGASVLQQNYPNPFGPSTRIDFELMQPEDVSIRIYDITGRLVTILYQGRLDAGRNYVHWDGRNADGGLVSSGVYYSVLETSSGRTSRKMVVIR